MLDLLLTGGTVVDGSGSPRRRADVGVKDGRIVAIGEVTGDAVTTVDATGKVITPGFIDVHTHFDAQVFWESALTPSPLHGVTTVIGGNCGFTIAPLSADPSDGDYLMRMLARVEGMPLESLRDGVPWSWKTTAEYLDAVEKTNLGVNAGFMVGHSAIRRIVMGTEATERPSTPDELVAMERLLHEGLDAGGFGFSSSWARTHNDADQKMVPSRYATREEILALCKVTGQHPGTSIEFIPMVGPFDDWAIELMADMSATAGRPLNWNVLTVMASNAEQSRNKLRAGDIARERGGKVVALTIPMNFGIRLSLASGFILDAMPGWEEPMLLPRDEKLKLFSDATARRHLNDLAQQQNNPMRGLANWSNKTIFDVVAEENREYVGRTVGEIAAEQGRDDWDVLCDITVADGMLTSFGSPAAPETDEDWRTRVEIWRDSRAVIGASDAGAHLDLLASFNYVTVVLSEAVRRRKLIGLEEAVHLMTAVQADLYGLVDRGRVVEGGWADLVVLDPETVASHEVGMRFDVPGGAGRLYAEADGIEHVFVNGQAIVRDGKLTNDRPGALLRSGRDSHTADLS
ncbi:MAG TPA: amidohydrolase family protein [Frankiaceae bacterium]|jgi:N-acyl-D-aspartate/D-glutamate deacylase|nr:amidohydrolase family protein [Frankiaceae bacterium]